MPSDLRTLLEEAARPPRTSLDVDEVRRRAQRSRVMEIAGVSVVAVALVVVGLVATSVLTQPQPDAPLIGNEREDAEQPTTTATTPTSDATPTDKDTPTEKDAPTENDAPTEGRVSWDEGVVAATDLGLDVLVPTDGTDGADGHLVIHHPDGTSRQLPIGAAALSDLTIVPDDQAGFSWQRPATEMSSPPIHHVDAGGASSVVVPATDGAEAYHLVGAAEGELLVTHRTGQTPEQWTIDLVRVGFDGEQQHVTRVGGWEESVTDAVALEHAAYTKPVFGGGHVITVPFGGEPTIAYEVDDSTDTHLAGLAMTGDGQVIAGIDDVSDGPQQATARMVTIDPSSATVTDTIDIPLRLGIDDEAVHAAGLSVEGDTVLVNRRLDVNSPWLPPLVHDLESGAWGVLDVPGRAFLARPMFEE